MERRSIPVPTSVGSGGVNKLFFSPAATVVGGEFPAFTPVTSLSLSTGVGPFTEGCRLLVNVEGPGSAVVADPKEFYVRGDEITITAIPDVGAFFLRWVGSAQTLEPTFTMTVGTDCEFTAGFSDRPSYFSSWRPEHFTNSELADPLISGADADPDGDGVSNAGEYAFGSDPRVADDSAEIEVVSIDFDQRSIEVRYRRPVLVADVSYSFLVSNDLEMWVPAIDSMELSIDEIEREGLVDDEERVTVRLVFDEDLGNAMMLNLSATVF